jgi:hypothetical protein
MPKTFHSPRNYWKYNSTTGKWSFTVIIPSNETPGVYQVTSYCYHVNTQGQRRTFYYKPVSINVGPPPSAKVLPPWPVPSPGDQRTLRVNGAQVCLDSSARVLSVSVFYDSQTAPIGTGTAAIGGSVVDVHFRVPPHANAGIHRLLVTCRLRSTLAPNMLTAATFRVYEGYSGGCVEVQGDHS